MMWVLAGTYCLAIWLVFAKWKLLRLSLPVAIAAASVGPSLLLAFLFCAQYYHPYTQNVRVFQKVVPIVPQMKQAGRVTKLVVEPNTPVLKGDVLFEVDKVPFQLAVDRLEAVLAEDTQSVTVAETEVELAEASVKRAEADLTYWNGVLDRNRKLIESNAISKQELEQTTDRVQQANSAFDQAKGGVTQAMLSVKAAKSRVAQTEASLASAKFDLEQTTVTAPSDGFVANLQLQPGSLVGGSGASAVMSFVQERSDRDRGVVSALIEQKNYLLVKPNQYAEVVLDGYPGRVFTGRVLTMIDMSGAGQLTAEGNLPEDFGSAPPARFAVRIKLDHANDLRLPGGTSGIAAIYTDNVPIAGLPVMVVLRMQSWLKYLL
ncbi:HlyD family secretion protein [Roseiconus nitratireducens]|uniref:HlyD family secretion protein n=1 Tax=Roseiconus nitratireducens TaxID=2605748 RepID=A0A5M6DDZ1_9BACT|nr:HlyD family secretion protein [Roseiconus nitratireducens]KAA5544349.1 HlyD family secretion protein [Roseiconus nitratireducens]